jgi:DNA polymerase III subunit gamma/tau
MSYLVLARKYRPQTFQEVVQQEHVTQTLMNAISSERVSHAILFSGPRGTGKTTVARILAKAMNCQKGPTTSPCNRCRSCGEITSGHAVDVHEIDGASNNSVDQIRDLRENVKYMPAAGLYKIYIIDEVHMLSVAAFNALLKTLEEPPAHIMFIFATTEPHKIPVTILSRCQRHDFKRVDLNAITEHLKNICLKEAVDIPTESLWHIAREADGSIRDALSLLDQVMAWGQRDLTTEKILDFLGVIDRKRLFEISSALIRKEIPELLDALEEAYGRGQDMRKLYADLIQHFRNLLIVKLGGEVDRLLDVPEHEIGLIGEQVSGVSETFLNQVFEQLFHGEADVRFSSQPKLALEMAFIRICRIKPTLPIETLIQKIDDLRNEILERGPTAPLPSPPHQGKNRHSGTPAPPLRKPREGAADSGPADTSQKKSEFDEDKVGLEDPQEKLLKVISQDSPALAANLGKCELHKLSDQCLEITVNNNGFCLNMIRRDKNFLMIEKACERIFGKRMTVKVTPRNDDGKENQKKKNHANQVQQEVLSHPVVAEAMEIFKGKIVDVKML